MKTAAIILATVLSALIAPSAFVEGAGHGRKLKQGAGFGSGCDSVLTQGDNGSGYLVEGAEDNLAGDIGGTTAMLGGGTGKKLLSYLGLIAHKRSLKQGAGFGAGCNSILTEGDNGSGYLVKDSENALAGDIANKPGGKKLLSAISGRSLQQLDKIAAGAGNLISAAGDPQAGDTVNTFGSDIDGQGTNDAAAEGAQVGQLEDSLPELAAFIPGRKMLGRALAQLDKMAAGADSLISAAGDPQAGAALNTFGSDIDGQGTNDAAADGAMVGNLEDSLPELANFIPGRH